MITYQLGSKVKGIIRSYTTEPIGDQEIEYVNQPYTIFDGARATVSFRDVEKTQRSGWNDAYYNASKPYEVKIYDVLITNKILNLILNTYWQESLSYMIFHLKMSKQLSN